ncbi:dynamin family protein [Celeribacter litoreus]|uniref:dynamin family protein n=1 Tax=Celeribacter litoreus TaxID=2876714 RepID=UPI001CCB17A3|nr:dynamin family protein [Celeribacter litoreus]MCA0043877.1 dynamin family protein [Celeribacter litoreus]
MFEIQPIGQNTEARIGDLASLVYSVALKNNEITEFNEILEKAVKLLSETGTTVSVVGQVKSGKSSLINAISGLGDFLPTEVNPWTAVITNLHFGHPDKPDAGAVFELFSEEEWKQMIEGDKESRELAEQLLPGFKSEVLEQQIRDMQESAKKRLGSLYHLLLGKKHRFSEVTPEILERYVSAGYGDVDVDEKSAGRFSGITKAADVFLPPEAFRVPVTLSDTPGINDPFLVRDALTTSSFKEADVFISAISVHQPLGPADVALLKMLATHTTKKTIVYVNRIDELEDPSLVEKELLPALQKRLSDELKKSNIILMTGSAYWGRLAATGSDEDVAKALESTSYKNYMAATGGEDMSLSPRARLYRASGMPELANCISSLIEEGPIDGAIRKAATEIYAAFELLVNILNERAEREGRNLVDANDIPQIADMERKRIGARLEQIEGALVELQAIQDQAHAEILKNGENVNGRIQTAIDVAISEFVDMQADELRDAFDDGNADGSWIVNIEPFCRRVELQVSKAYQLGRAHVDMTLERHADQMNERVAPFVGEMSLGGLLRNMPFDMVFPSFKPRSLLIEMEFKVDRGWKFWQKKSMSAEEAAERLKRMVSSEVKSAEAELRATAVDAIAKRNAEGMQRLQSILHTASNLLGSEGRALATDLEKLNKGDARERVKQIYDERNARAQWFVECAEEIEAAKSTLARQFPETLSGKTVARLKQESVTTIRSRET